MRNRLRGEGLAIDDGAVVLDHERRARDGQRAQGGRPVAVGAAGQLGPDVERRGQSRSDADRGSPVLLTVVQLDFGRRARCRLRVLAGRLVATLVGAGVLRSSVDEQLGGRRIITQTADVERRRCTTSAERDGRPLDPETEPRSSGSSWTAASPAMSPKHCPLIPPELRRIGRHSTGVAAGFWACRPNRGVEGPLGPPTPFCSLNSRSTRTRRTSCSAPRGRTGRSRCPSTRRRRC